MKQIAKLTDEDLAERVRTSDPEAFRFIVKRYQVKLLRYINLLIGDANMAEDAVQAAFIKTYVNLNSFDKRKKFSSWIYRIAHNEAINLVKKEKMTLPVEEWTKDLRDQTDLEVDLEKKQVKKAIEQCFLKMPLKYREPLVLYYIEEKSYEEVSDTLRLPINTVATRIRRGKVLLAKLCLVAGAK